MVEYLIYCRAGSQTQFIVISVNNEDNLTVFWFSITIRE